MLRRLRIAASVFFAVVTVALVVLWVRSYQWVDIVYVHVGDGHSAVSMRGTIYTDCGSSVPSRAQQSWHRLGLITTFSIWNGDGKVAVNDVQLTIPTWSSLLATSVVAAFPWLRWRFSLRTLLIATTLVAVVLGLGVWLAS